MQASSGRLSRHTGVAPGPKEKTKKIKKKQKKFLKEEMKIFC
jgi:hypothetical protein